MSVLPLSPGAGDPPVRILILEDVPADAELIEAALARADLRFTAWRVDTRRDFEGALTSFAPDIVLADYRLPFFNALDALRLLKALKVDVPFILVTGSQTEEVAVECMKAGAADYILKSSLTRLPAAVLNALGKRAAQRGRTAAEDALRRSEARYRLIADNTRDLIAVVDVLGQVTYASPSFREVLGRSPDELLGAPVTCAMHPDDRDRAEQAFRGARGDGRPRTVELRFEPMHGETCTFEVAVSSVRDTPREAGALVLVARDVAERRRMQEALRASEERYALAVQGANDGIWDWDLRRNEVHYSPRWKAMLGYAEEEIGKGLEEWLDRVEPAHAEGLKRTLALHVEGGTPHFEHEHPLRRKDGSWLWTLSRGVAVRDATGAAYRMAGSQTDISKRKTAEDELRRAASRDPLTGLANRSLFRSRLEHAVRRASRGDFRFAVLFLDLDQFKVINDSLGHLLGDHLLSGAARRLERCVRPGDTVARMGGDEFTLLLEDVRDEREAVRVAERVLQELRHCFELDGHEVFTSASIGIALGGLGTDVPEHLMRDADTALYRAKSLGRGRYQVFDRHMHESAVARLQLETELRRALERGEFRLHYQPIVSLGTGAIVGFEALTRWQHPRRGLLPADEFIGVTEENGLILALGRSVMRQACDQAQAWHLRFPQHGLVMSVNLSGRQFSQPDLAAQVEGALQASGLEPQRLALEITESVVMDHAGAAGHLLSDLKRLRVGLNVDDFGTGYSSLSYLQRFPIDALKIDGSFVSRLGADDDSLEIVRTITTLAHNLGLQVTAEGVETADQLRELRALGCESGQGFHFARALEAEQATALLERQPHW